MEENASIPMERAGMIIRRSIHTFLKNYHYFSSTCLLLVFPFSTSILLSQAVIPSSLPRLLLYIHAHLQSLFDAAGFSPLPLSFSLLNLKLSQMICSTILTLPFTLSFLLVAKAAAIQALRCHKASFPSSLSSFLTLYTPLLLTHLCNSFILLSANAAAFSLFFLAFNSLNAFSFSPNVLILSAVEAVLYSVIIANTLIICNLALAVAGMENCGGYLAILKACVLIRGRASTALSLTLSVNLGLAAVETLFQYRVVRTFHLSNRLTYSIVLEGLLISYLYSLLIVVDTISTCIFYKSCKSGPWIDGEDRYYYRIEHV